MHVRGQFRKRILGDHIIGGSMSPRVGLDAVTKRKIHPSAGNPNPVVYPVVQTLY
jgi:hypothetical protein